MKRVLQILACIVVVAALAVGPSMVKADFTGSKSFSIDCNGNWSLTGTLDLIAPSTWSLTITTPPYGSGPTLDSLSGGTAQDSPMSDYGGSIGGVSEGDDFLAVLNVDGTDMFMPATATCPSSPAPTEEAPPPPAAPMTSDGRISESPAQAAAVYPASGGIQVLQIDSSGQGTAAVSLTQSQADAVTIPETIDDQSKPIDCSANGAVCIYRLTTGEWQVNTKLPDGKTETQIFVRNPDGTMTLVKEFTW